MRDPLFCLLVCLKVTAYPLLLFGGDIRVDHEQGIVTLDEWLSFKSKAKTGALARFVFLARTFR